MYVIYSDISAFRKDDYRSYRHQRLFKDAVDFQAYCFYLLGPNVALCGRGYFYDIGPNTCAAEVAAHVTALSLLPDGVNAYVESDLSNAWAFNNCSKFDSAMAKAYMEKKRNRLIEQHEVYSRLFDQTQRLIVTLRYVKRERRSGLYHRCHDVAYQMRRENLPYSKCPVKYPPGIFKVAEDQRDFNLTMELLRSLRKWMPDFDRLQDFLREERRLFLAATSSGCPEQPTSPAASESRSLIPC